MERITRRAALAVGAAGAILPGGEAAAAEVETRGVAETAPAVAFKGLVYRTYNVTAIPRGGKDYPVAGLGPYKPGSLIQSLAAFDVSYTDGGGYKVRGVRASAIVTGHDPVKGTATIRCVCEMYDDDSHNSVGSMTVMLIAEIA